MTGDDLKAWQQSRGLTQRQAAQALDISLATYKRYLTGTPPHVIDLACAAISANLPPYSQSASTPKTQTPLNAL